MRCMVKNRPRNQALTIYPGEKLRAWPRKTGFPKPPPSEIDQAIQQERESALDPRKKDLIERLLRTYLRMVRNVSIVLRRLGEKFRLQVEAC